MAVNGNNAGLDIQYPLEINWLLPLLVLVQLQTIKLTFLPYKLSK